jgi:TonB-dependent SusC/RagA subfamily outer membrane receptor
MPYFITYFLKVSAVLTVMYLFYSFVLRRLTFYNLNRLYLLGYSLLAFLIPFTNITSLLEKHELQQNEIVRFVPSFPSGLVTEEKGFEWTVGNILWLVFLTGVIIMIVRTIIQFISLYRLKQSASLLNDKGVKLFHVEKNIIPFSFHNAIYLNRNLHTEEDLKEIIQHEFVHIKQKHSVDILLGELLCIVMWFNPFAWFMRRAIRQNLEFIADRYVLNNGLDKKQYQYLLLKVMGNNHYSVVANFNFSSLKNRIAMMNQMKTARVHVMKFLFVLPLLALLLLSFRDRMQNNSYNSSNKQGGVNDKSVVVAFEPIKQQGQFNSFTDTIPEKQNLPQNLESIKVEKTNGIYKGIHKITIKSKDGTTEVFNINNIKEREAFEKKYGSALLVQPPAAEAPVSEPSAVTAPAPASEMSAAIAPVPPVAEIAPVSPVVEAAPVSPTPPVVLNSKGFYLSIADNDGERIVIVKDKSKKIVEAIKLTDWSKKEQEYEKKYGKLPPPPPPPPVPPATATVKVKISEDEVLAGGNVKWNNDVTPLYIMDGKEVQKGILNSIDPNTIDHINILKGSRATTLYGNKGANGVVEITTKGKALNGTIEPKLNLTTKGVAGGFPSGALYVIDSKEVTLAEVEKLNPDMIASISILKNESAVKVYGEKAKHGAILITTKTKAATNSKEIL